MAIPSVDGFMCESAALPPRRQTSIDHDQPLSMPMGARLRVRQEDRMHTRILESGNEIGFRHKPEDTSRVGNIARETRRLPFVRLLYEIPNSNHWKHRDVVARESEERREDRTQVRINMWECDLPHELRLGLFV